MAEQKGRVAYLAYTEEMASHAPLGHTLFAIGEEADTATQAKLLFRVLRDADKENFDAIYAPLPSTDGMGMALYNRMIRAAAHQIIKL